MTGDTGPKLITLLLPHGSGPELQRRLFEELGVTRLDLHSARGFIGADPAGLFNRVEKEILEVVVEAPRADEIFEWLYHEGRVSELEGRFLYVTPLRQASHFELPADIPAEGADQE